MLPLSLYSEFRSSGMNLNQRTNHSEGILFTFVFASSRSRSTHGGLELTSVLTDKLFIVSICVHNIRRYQMRHIRH